MEMLSKLLKIRIFKKRQTLKKPHTKTKGGHVCMREKNQKLWKWNSMKSQRGNGKGQRKREELRQNNAVKAKQIHSLRCQHLWSAVSHAAENQVESREREQIYLADSW